MQTNKHSDLFITTLHELHSKAPAELLGSLREHLDHIKHNNPNSAQTAEACLAGLASDDSTLLHVLTAAYLINGGVMLKHTMEEENQEKTLADLEEELLSFGITEDLAQETFCGRQSPPHPHERGAPPQEPSSPQPSS